MVNLLIIFPQTTKKFGNIEVSRLLIEARTALMRRPSANIRFNHGFKIVGVEKLTFLLFFSEERHIQQTLSWQRSWAAGQAILYILFNSNLWLFSG